MKRDLVFFAGCVVGAVIASATNILMWSLQ